MSRIKNKKEILKKLLSSREMEDARKKVRDAQERQNKLTKQLNAGRPPGIRGKKNPNI